ncbi:MAG TPA: TonB family protein, partial [Terriglobales bacterium]|nr:TonB family protein [Terriglobales bacterium]
MKSELFDAFRAFAVVFAVSLPVTGASDEPVLRVGHGVTAPRPLNELDPEYSEEARRAGLQGKCVLSLVVNSEGKPEHIRVSRSLGMGLDEKAVEALRQWTFEPARKDGKPVAVKVRVVMTFHIGKGFGKMPPDQRRTLERARKEAAEYAWTHVYRVEANTADCVCRPTHMGDQGSPVSISGLPTEVQGYRLESITFTDNKALTNAAALRSVFPIQDGDPFDPSKVADGFQQLKTAYAAQGFASFKASVDPEIDDVNRRVALRIKCDEGR